MAFLSICIPTYNRCAQLDRQLAWLETEIAGIDRPDRLEVLVLDNASTDDTEMTVSNWRARVCNTGIKTNFLRNSSNIGGMKNLARCIELSTGDYTWTIGDDDPIELGTLRFVLDKLESIPNLAILFLNFSDIDLSGNTTVSENWFPVDLEEDFERGKEVFERSLAHELGSVMFLTSTVYRTKLPQAALAHWPESAENWGGQIFWSGFCAARGPVFVTKHSYVKCLIGASHWLEEEGIWARIHFHDLPEIYNRLYSIGYSAEFCGWMLQQNFNEICEAQKSLLVACAKMLKHGLRWHQITARSLYILAWARVRGLIRTH